MELVLDDTQQSAFDACCDTDRRIVPITGQAGTGKTTMLKRVHEFFRSKGITVVLCAPTGKAAKRITEATGIEARTIHRLLEYPFPGELDKATGKALISTDPKRDRRTPLDFFVVLADEYAMVNTEVHRNLLDALPSGGLIRMFGDANQLAPIESSKKLQGEPSPFMDMLTRFDGIRLTTIHRQAEGSDIILNGDRIIKGIMPRRTEEFDMKITERPVRAIEDLVMEGLENGVDFSQTNNQIISPIKKGWVGTVALNGMIQGLLQSASKPSLNVARHPWFESDYLRLCIDDKVIFTVNNYTLGVFNGETGIVRSFDAAGTVLVDFGDKLVPVPNVLAVETIRGTSYINPQKDLELAYCITTHKAQGSEYNSVVYVINRSRQWNLNRKNFYTGISRARKQVTVIADQVALQVSLSKRE